MAKSKGKVTGLVDRLTKRKGKELEIDLDRHHEPDVHVMRPGDTTRPPTEEEKLADEFEGTIATDTDEGIKERAELMVERLAALRSNRRRWNEFTHVQRTAMLGAKYALQEVLGQEEEGVPVRMSQYLGVDFARN